MDSALTRSVKRFFIGIATVQALGLVAFCLGASYAFAAEQSSLKKEGAIGPDQRVIAAVNHKLDPIKPEKSNGDYLRNAGNFKSKDPLSADHREDIPYNTDIFTKEVTDEMQQKFSFTREYEAREAYNLNDQHAYMQNNQNHRDLVEWTLKKLLQYHLDNTVKTKVEKAAKEAVTPSKTVSSKTGSSSSSSNSNAPEKGAAQAALTISKIHSALRNTTINFSEKTKTRFRYDIPSGRLTFGFISPIFDAEMDYRTRVGSNAAFGSPADQPEKLSVGLFKKLDFVDASTNVRYGLVSENLNCGVNKHIVGPLTAQVDQAKNFRDTSRDETSFRLNFGTNF